MNGSDSKVIGPSAKLAVLPHEWVFGGFLALTVLRLIVAGSWNSGWLFVFLGCLLGSGAVIVWAGRNPQPLRWRVRLLFYPAAMGLSFLALGKVLPLHGGAKVDALLLGWDRALLGETPSVAWEP